MERIGLLATLLSASALWVCALATIGSQDTSTYRGVGGGVMESAVGKMDLQGLSVEHIRGSPPAHGVQRFHDGLDVGEVVAEYNLLRVAFITVAERHDLYIVAAAARIINHGIEAVRTMQR